jgi:GNAT superfamily N-acetyltransferase
MATSGLLAEREAIKPLLSMSDPGDALTAYYALHHPPALTQLHLHRSDAGRVDGFLAACITGADLFRPLVVTRAETDGVLEMLLRQELPAGRPYHFVAPLGYVAVLEREVQLSEERVGVIQALDPLRFEPVVNVLVVPAEGASGGLRFEIRSQGRVMAAAGTNWRSPGFAEIYVYTEPEARGRGWGRSVVSALTAALLTEGVRPLYVVEEGDQASSKLAAALGYYDTGEREFSASGVRR